MAAKRRKSGFSKMPARARRAAFAKMQAAGTLRGRGKGGKRTGKATFAKGTNVVFGDYNKKFFAKGKVQGTWNNKGTPMVSINLTKSANRGKRYVGKTVNWPANQVRVSGIK